MSNQDDFLVTKMEFAIEEECYLLALELSKRYLAKHPDHLDGRWFKALALYFLDREAEARIELENLLPILEGERLSDAHHYLGNIYRTFGFVKTAEQSYLKAIEVMANQIGPYRELTSIYERTGREAEAEGLIDKALSLEMEDKEELLFIRGDLYRLKGQLGKALECYEAYEQFFGEEFTEARKKDVFRTGKIIGIALSKTESGYEEIPFDVEERERQLAELGPGPIWTFHDRLDPDANKRCQNWRNQYPDGIIINCQTSKKWQAHRIDCAHLGDTTYWLSLIDLDDDRSFTKKRKICSLTYDPILALVKEEDAELTYCSDCNPETLGRKTNLPPGDNENQSTEPPLKTPTSSPAAQSLEPIDKPNLEEKVDSAKVLTLFSFGYHGWGTSTEDLVRVVDAIEAQRGFAPPVWVDARIRRTVRAPGFREHAFETLLGSDRYRWMKGLGNQAIVDGDDGIKIAQPSEARTLLDLAIHLQGENRRLLFFCSCAWSRAGECHRHTVGKLVIKEAKKRQMETTVVEWPGGASIVFELKVEPSLLKEIARGREYIPIQSPDRFIKMGGPPWGSIVTLIADDARLSRLIGCLQPSPSGYVLPIIGSSEDPDYPPEEYSNDRERILKGFGLLAKKA